MIRLGITGGIGSGKTYVARLLADNYHVPVYDSDSRARSLMLEPQLRRQVEELVGPEAYLADGTLNRSAVAAYLFADAAHAAAIDAVVHPAVKADFRQWAQSQDAPVVVLESAILVEAGFMDVTDRLIVVEAPQQLRIRRAMARDGASRQQVLARINRQASDEERRAQADLVVTNDGRPIMPQLRFFMAQLLGKSAENA